jgi:hypothetical protein
MGCCVSLKITAEKMLMDVDPDKSGKVSFEEFVTLLQSTRGVCAGEEVQQHDVTQVAHMVLH